MRSALLAVLDRDLDAAEQLLTRAVGMDSSAPEPYVALARLYRMRGEIGRAIRMHQNLLLRQDLDREQTVSGLLDLAEDFREGGFHQRAIASFEEALERDPKQPRALAALLPLLADAHDYDRALVIAGRLAKLDREGAAPRECALRVEMAAAAMAEGRSDDARRTLKTALRRDAGSVAAWIALGTVEAERGKPKAALAAWARVPRIDRRQGPEVYPRLEATYAALDRARDFEGYLEKLLDEEPDDPDARLALARALAARGEIDAAIRGLRELVDRQPDDLEARASLARLCATAGREAEAAGEISGLVDALERRGLLRAGAKP